jgi:uncharacterized protein YjbI with pentapeptide repeats
MGEADEQQDQAGHRFSQEQCDMLKRCSGKEDMTEWNKWRREHPDEDVKLEEQLCLSHWYLKGIDLHQLAPRSGSSELEQISRARVYLQGVVLDGANLEGADLSNADLTGAGLVETHLERARLSGTCLRSVCALGAHFENAGMEGTILSGANLQDAHLEGAMLTHAKLIGTNLHIASINDSTIIWKCTVNRHSKMCRGTDLSGVALDTVKIDPGTKQLLEYNIRRKNWEDWYKEHRILAWAVWPFWLISDYGLSASRITGVFIGLALAFAAVYYAWASVTPPGVVEYLLLDSNGQRIAGWLVPIRALYFSLVTMTVGFTDMHANPHSICAYLLVTFQMLLGYVLLGALITRFAVLFTTGGPTGTFADEMGVASRSWRSLRKERGRKAD